MIVVTVILILAAIAGLSALIIAYLNYRLRVKELELIHQRSNYEKRAID